MIRIILMIAASIILSGCSYHGWWHDDYDSECDTCGMSITPQFVTQPTVATKPSEVRQQADLQPLLIRVTGYGALDTTKKAATERKLLMAMRASKLDAYRTLAERVYGTQVFGSSKVQDLVLENDQLRTIIDSNIRGAKVISVNRLKGGGYETIVEMTISSSLRRCLANGASYSDVCSMLVSSVGSGMQSSKPVTDSADHAGGLFYLH